MPTPDPIYPDAVENLDVATAQANLDAARLNLADTSRAVEDWRKAVDAWTDTLGQMLAEESGWAVGDHFEHAGHTYRVTRVGAGQDDDKPRLMLGGVQVNKDGSEAKRGRDVAPWADRVKKVDGPDA